MNYEQVTCLWKFHGRVFLRRKYGRLEGKMRKKVFKRKNKKIAGTVTKATTGIVAFAVAVSLMLGTVMTAYGEETGQGAGGAALKTVVTDIFHRHVGSPDTGGGCYTDPIEHVHQGDALNGGGCYTRPVEHKHTGSPETGGGCYQTAIPHTQHGPECYRSETHTHDSSCLSGRCTITYTLKEIIETYTDTCRVHGVTTHERRAAIASHSDCGKGEVDTVVEQCQSCTNSLTRTHTYINCGKQEGTTQVLDCNKTIDGYDLSCGYTEGGTEYYERECDGAPDGYRIGCGLEEDSPCGKLILTSRTGSDAAKVVISAKVEDLTGGRLVLSRDPYVWKDQEGNVLGSGESLEVDKNGNYSVTVSLENKDVDESGLCSSISVDSIQKATPTATPTATPAATATATPTATPTPSASIAPTAAPSATMNPAVSPERTPEITSSPAPAVVPEKTPEPSDVSEENPGKEDEGEDKDADKEEDGEGEGDRGTEMGREVSEENQPEEILTEDRAENENSGRSSNYERRNRSAVPSPAEEEQALASPSPKSEEKIKKDTKTVTVSGNNAAQEREYKVGRQTKKNGFFQSTAAKIITVTLSTLFVFAGVILLVLYLLCSVRIFNDDGEGRMVYLGRLLVRKKDGEYSLVITETMTEKSCTNRYCIKPGLFRLGKKEDQELIVCRDTKKAVASLSREMIVIL